MDINSLLSPQEPPRGPPPSAPPVKAPVRKPRNPRSTKVTQPSPLANTTLPPPTLPYNAVAHAQQYGLASPNNISPGVRPPLSSTSSLTPPAETSRQNRQPSTAGMDTLAELASMQHHQQTARANAGGLRSEALYDHTPSSAPALPNILSMPGAQASGELRDPSQLIDMAMSDGPTETPPRKLSTGALSQTDLQTVTELMSYLTSNPFAYESHVQLINLLHQGFLNHIWPSSSRPGNPHTYDLLPDLQGARESMDLRFALGEDLWSDWVEDRILLAGSLDDRISIMELCQKAVDEEPSSTKLWLVYGEYMLLLYKSANPHMEQQLSGIGKASTLRALSEEERLVAQEVFTWQQMLNVWERGAQETHWHINDSHLIWDQHMEILLQELAATRSPAAIEDLKARFVDRLQTPHATWDQTFQAYSMFISNYNNESYENAMIKGSQLGAEAKRKYGTRGGLEYGLSSAQERNDRVEELKTFVDYLQWELDQSHKKKAFDFKLASALYQRATLRFPTNNEFWEGYAMLVNEEITHHPHQDLSTLPVLAKATRHCPWSGSLWFQFLLAAENAKLSYINIEHMKHKATSTGVLDAGGMEEVLKVNTAWCGFLRRRAFHQSSTDEELDVAEVGIRSAIEDMETLGRQKYGKGYQGDPEYRLEKIYIKFLTQCRNWEGARQAYKKLVHKKGDSYEFWVRYYIWEMNTWSKLAYSENGNGNPKPTEATKVLQQALKRQKMDWPEKVIEMYRYHCEDHEDVAELQSSLAVIWKARKAVQKRREKEAEEAYEAAQAQAYQQQQQAQHDVAAAYNDSNNVGKRKREDEVDDGTSKKARGEGIEQLAPQVEEQIPAASSQLKRDRENATIVVKNLPVGVKDTRLRQFFKDCGAINTLKITTELSGEAATAIIEFDSKEDVLSAQTKDMKTFDGRSINVEVESGSTLYVCNFPPTADEVWMREKFQKYGEIVDVRFPSLKYNTHRRFCYLKYQTSSQAHGATELDGEDLGGNLTLDVKISDPTNKKPREGAIYEGRELYLANLDWKADRADIKKAFSKYGKIESIRIPTKANGSSKGIGYVVFRSKEEAAAALEMNLVQFKTRILNVSISSNDKNVRQATHIITSRGTSQRDTASPTPDLYPSNTSGTTHTAASPTPPADSLSKSAEIQSRTLALMSIPDTVNDARIRALAEPYGDLVMVKLRPSHQGAILEYRDQTSVGKAALGLEGHEIAPGRLIITGTVQEMNHHKAEYRSDKIAVGAAANSTSASLQSSAPIRRPNQPGARRGGRGGLGMKRGGVGLSGDRAKGDGEMNGTGTGDGQEEQGKAKSNADFKAMFFRKEGS